MTSLEPEKSYVVFVGDRREAVGALLDVVRAAKTVFERGACERIVFFDESSGRAFDVDLTGAESEVLGRVLQHPAVGVLPAPARGRGRPRLGVVSREVSLLPRHWHWLGAQPSGASATLRRLVDAARKAESADRSSSRAIDAAHAFMWEMAGDRPGFEEASRALYRREFDGFDELIASWPVGIRRQLAKFLSGARQEPAPETGDCSP